MEELLLRLLKESPESFVGLVHGYIEKYKPAVYEVGKEIVNVARDYANNTEIFNDDGGAKTTENNRQEKP